MASHRHRLRRSHELSSFRGVGLLIFGVRILSLVLAWPWVEGGPAFKGKATQQGLAKGHERMRFVTHRTPRCQCHTVGPLPVAVAVLIRGLHSMFCRDGMKQPEPPKYPK